MKHHNVAQLVQNAYANSNEDFGKWMWENHLQLVARKAEELAQNHNANVDLAVAGAWLHDFGDAFVHRHSQLHDQISALEAQKVLEEAGYAKAEITEVLEIIIKPHSCKDGSFPTTVEGKILATADAYAHLMTDFYLQFTWKHLPDNKSYLEFIDWVREKLRRDFNDKIFFEEVSQAVASRYESLLEVYTTQNSSNLPR